MKGNTATIFARGDGAGYTEFYRTKPVFKTRKNWWGETESYGHTRNIATIGNGALRALLGSGVRRNQTVKITIRKNAKSAQGKALFAASANGVIALSKKEPTLVTETEERLGGIVNWDTYERGPSKMVKVTRLAEKTNSLAEFCASGFNRGTGLRLPKNKVTRLTVKVTPVSA